MTMTSVQIGEDREEGEIVDDDLEDISDNSIVAVDVSSGKSVTPKGHLPALCLSDISENEEPVKLPLRPKRRISPQRRVRRKSLRKRKPRHHTKQHDSDSEDDSSRLDRRLQKQLKAAIRVENGENHLNNSLRTRLKGMTKGDHVSTDEKDDKSLTENLDSNDQDEVDNELIKLRMEALKTTFLNKLEGRKKRKIEDVQNSENDKDENNRIGNVVSCNENETPNKKICPSQVSEVSNNTLENNPQDEDEDVLRAILLASMSKKITNVKIPATVQRGTVKANSSNFLAKGKANLLVKNKANTNIQNPILPVSNVKPIIIDLNGDSDSDDASSKVDQMENSNKTKLEIETSVHKFLKVQRAKVEAEKEVVVTLKQTKAIDKTLLEKSSVKLLPKEQQIEYQKLLMKLKNAQNCKVRRASHRTNEKVQTNFTKGSQKKVAGNRVLINRQTETRKVDPVVDISNELKLLHKTFKEMQVAQNGKLRIQKKYLGLMETVKKINQVSSERQKLDKEMKRILEELAETKKKLQTTQVSFVQHVKELVAQKEVIDKTLINQENNSKILSTSTPLKRVINNKQSLIDPVKSTYNTISSNKSSTKSNENKENGNKNIDLPNKETEVKDKFEKSTVIEIIARNKDEPLDDITSKYCSDFVSNEDNVIQLTTDPTSDLQNISMTISNNESVNVDVSKTKIPKYVSPLVSVSSTYVVDDPFAIMCPYEIDGNCCDPDCMYKHFRS